MSDTSSMMSSSTINEEKPETDNSGNKWLLLAVLLLLLLLLLLGLYFSNTLINSDGATANVEDDGGNYAKTPKPPPGPPPTTTTTSTTTTTTPPWKDTEYICKYDGFNSVYYERAVMQKRWPEKMCQTVVFIRSDIYDPTFEQDMQSFTPIVKNISSTRIGFMLAGHYSGNKQENDVSDLPNKMVELINRHSFNRGGVLYVYNRTVDSKVSDFYLTFATTLNQSNIRSFLIVEMYSNWEKQFDLAQLAENNLFAIFRSHDIINALASQGVQCQDHDKDPTGPSTFTEEMNHFKNAFNGKFDAYRMKIGFYAYKEGQKGKNVPRNQFVNGTISFGLLYGKCTDLPIDPGDTDCTTKYVFEQQVKKEEFLSWTGTFIYVLHQENFDRTLSQAQCSTNAYVFMMQHHPINNTSF